jgi:hypothetical protein
LTVGAHVVVSGAVGDADLNGTYEIQTVTGTTTFTITTANVTDATYALAGGEKIMVLTTTAMQDTRTYWSIQRLFYDTSNRLVKRAWANGSQSPALACASRATYGYR